mgnify:CR=1 FL=1|tara:strand:- start:947 stop:1222 length:276 start_codon:yes stop_codon:yes gene_type:complete
MRIIIKTPNVPYELPSDNILFIPNETIYSINVPDTTKIQSLKYIIQDKEGVHHSACRLVYNGILLENHNTLNNYALQEDAVLYLYFRLRFQ